MLQSSKTTYLPVTPPAAPIRPTTWTDILIASCFGNIVHIGTLLSFYHWDDPVADRLLGVPGRPNNIVYHIMWGILYVTTGVAWVKARKCVQVVADVYFLVLSLVILMWWILYSGVSKTAAIISPILTLLWLGMSLCIQNTLILNHWHWRKWLIPLAVWQVYLVFLNTYEVSV